MLARPDDAFEHEPSETKNENFETGREQRDEQRCPDEIGYAAQHYRASRGRGSARHRGCFVVCESQGVRVAAVAICRCRSRNNTCLIESATGWNMSCSAR